ncbi:MAG: hypothetical protein U9P72_07105 [Campylobacterota bacterium]|nr:hypothetical protein [Campylobacterota bacterium]
MAEFEDDIVIIAEDDAAGFDDSEQNTNSYKNENEEELKKKKLLIFGGAAIAFVLIILIVVLAYIKFSDKESELSLGDIEEKLKENKQIPIEPSKLENMIAKANYLYTSGSKEKALSLYEQIAVFSEAISVYNLGVAQLKNQQYKLALQTFQKAILNDEKRCVSAINAAVCCLHLEQNDSFNYYIDLAYAYLPNELDSPLYSYYYALINYYNNNYLEALSALNNPSSKEYPASQKYLTTKINALFENNYDALEAMEKNYTQEDAFNIALLYARVGDITLAQKYFKDAILQNIEPVKSQLALGLVNLKAGQVATGAKQIKNITDMFPEEVYEPYPITVTLKDSIFISDLAQKNYRENIVSSTAFNYQKIFYFSPYKIFNANNTISYIRKGNANIFIDAIDGAKDYLRKGISSSSVNIGIAKAIKKALSFKIRKANEELVELLKIQPKHSILHYNIALTFAQMGNIPKAHKHFLRSYHLDAKNYLSGIYAIMTSQLINKNSDKLRSIITNALSDEEENERIDFLTTLLTISKKNFIRAVDWLDNDYKERPLYLAIEVIVALNLSRHDLAKEPAKRLVTLLPNNILPHMMNIDVEFFDLETKEYAKEVAKYLKVQNFHFNDLYHGPYITRYLYIQQNLITGRLYFLRQQIKDVLESTTHDKRELTSSLALASLYDKVFEESYSLYNHLIDNLRVRDANTLFLGAVASTAAQHHENAIILLELSKMKDTNFLESRYALGLLYLQVQNNQGASIQLGMVGDSGFTSDYFNFKINLDQLLFEKQNSHKY